LGGNIIKALFLLWFVLTPALFSHDLPTESPPADRPLRIVSLVPSLTESLFDLGCGDRLVGVTEFCLFPPQAQLVEHVGSVVSINTERIVELRPDFVLALGMREQKSVLKLKSLGLVVHHFESPKNFTEICEQFLLLGRLCHRENEARAIVDQSREAVHRIKALTAKLPVHSAFIQLGSKPLFAATGESFTSDYLRYAGGRNIAEQSPSGLFSREAVLAADPDLIIIASMGLHTEGEKSQWQAFSDMKAVRRKAIHVVDAVRYCVPTPGGFVKALTLTARLLHPNISL
jgi:iron complex transport system substrate-binding protein